MDALLILLGSGKVAIIDSCDSDLVSNYVWQELKLRDTSYAFAEVDGSKIYMHRLIMDAPEDMEVDHKNGDGLDNRRVNLRVVTHQQNLANQRLSRANTTGYKGVCRNRSGTFFAQTKFRGKWFGLGSYHTDRDAARAYDLFMFEKFGEHARLNIPEEIMNDPPVRISEEETIKRKTSHLVGHSVSEETRKKIGESNKARRTGVPWTQAQRDARKKP